MNIIFYKNLSPPETLNKKLEVVVSYEFEWKPSSSVLAPVIHIDTEVLPFITDYHKTFIITDNEDNLLGGHPHGAQLNDNFKLLECNYAYIRQFGRYYYITNLTSVRNNLWEVELQVDVLMSFKREILNLSGIIARNEFEFNELLVDNLVPSENTHTVFFNLFSKFKSKITVGDVVKEYEWELADVHYMTVNMTAVSNVLEVGDTATEMYYSPNITNLAQPYFFRDGANAEKMLKNILNPSFWDSFGNGFVNAADYWCAFYAIPLNLYDAQLSLLYDDEDINRSPIGLLIKPDEFYLSSVYFGTKEVSAYQDIVEASTETGNALVLPTSRVRMWSKISDLTPSFTIDSFIDTTPFSKYLLYLPFIGTVEIPSERIQRGLNYIIYDVDVATGNFLATISNTEPSYLEPVISGVLDSWQGNMYIELPKGSTNAAELHRNRLIAVADLASDVIGAGVSIYNGTSMRTPKKKALSKKGKQKIEKTATELTGDIFDSLLTFATSFIPSGSSTGISDDILKFRISTSPFLIKIQSNFYYPDNYNHEFGRPLQEERKLSSLRGFTSLSAVHLEKFSNATLEELEEIEDWLLQGIILPTE